MRIRAKYRISGAKWRIIRQADPRDDDGQPAQGLCSAATQTIIIQTRLTEAAAAETLLHELLHACWSVAELPESYEEKVVARLSPILFATLRDNNLGFGE